MKYILNSGARLCKRSRLCRYPIWFSGAWSDAHRCRCFIENQASHALLTKLGFEAEGILRQYIYQNGLAHDTRVYSLLKNQFHLR